MSCIAQDDLFERSFERIAEDANNTPEIEIIEKYRLNPLNLATADVDDLTSLPEFSNNTSKKIIRMARHGFNISQISDSLKLTAYQKLLLDRLTIIDLSKKEVGYYVYRVRNTQQVEQKQGFTNGNFMGNSLDLYQRLTKWSKKYEFGILTNKDAGELDVYDFITGYIKYKHKNFNLVAGDFYPQFGLGNIMWRPFGSRKGASAVSPVTETKFGIRPWRSSLEYGYLRGISGSTRFFINNINFEVDIFGSYTYRDATIDNTNSYATSIDISGYKRTENEISKRDNLTEISTGSTITGNYKDFTIGIGGIYLDYSLPLLTSSKSMFYGQNGSLFSSFISYEKDYYTISAEASIDAKNNFAMQSGALIKQEKIDLAFRMRYFNPDFRSPFGDNFGEASYPANELGFYSAIYFKPIDNIRLTAYADFYSAIADSWGLPTKVNGIDLFNQTTIKINNLELLLRLRSENKTDAKNDALGIKYITQKMRNSLRFELKKEFFDDFIFRSRFEYIKVNWEKYFNDESGALLFVEVRYNKEDYGISARTSYYSTDSYDSAIWQFEYSMPGLMTTPPLYGDGYRIILKADYKPFDFMRLWTKIEFGEKNNINEIGSGYDAVAGNHLTRIYLQAEFNF